MHSTHRFHASPLRRVVLQFAVGITDNHVAWLKQFGPTITELNLDACHRYGGAQ